MPECLNCEETVTATTYAMGIDTEYCALCFVANAEACSQCGALGIEDSFAYHCEHNGPTCPKCHEAEVKKGREDEEAFYLQRDKEWKEREAYLPLGDGDDIPF